MILAQIVDREKNKIATKQRLRVQGERLTRSNRGGRCVFIVENGEDGAFCDAPALAGSAYCGPHHDLCAVRPGSEAARDAIRNIEREAARMAPVPDEFAYLSCVSPPELDCADDPRDIAACIDVVPPDDRIDE